MFAAKDEVVAKRGTYLAAALLVPLVIGSTWLLTARYSTRVSKWRRHTVRRLSTSSRSV